MVELPTVGGGSYPSIFNDVIGPVMRGPSSSHCAAAVRIGRMARELMGGDLREVLVEFHPTGSLATTHESQGSDMGLFGGLLGWKADDARLVGSARAIREAGIGVEIRITDFPAFHPNTYRLTLRNGAGEHRMTALSTGGGMIRVVELDGVLLDLEGDYHETLVFFAPAGAFPERLEAEVLEGGVPVEEVRLRDGGDSRLLEIRTRAPLSPETLARLRRHSGVRDIRTLSPVLPIQSRSDLKVPFLSAAGLEEYDRHRGLALWELAAHYEAARGGIGQDEVLRRMVEIVAVLEHSLEEGLAGTEYSDRILGPQAGLFRTAMEEGSLLDAGLLNRMILYVTAFMEVKSSMGVIVAAPTAGACGALPGACLAAAHHLGATREDTARGMLAAGIVGVFIAARSTFAAEVCGCQAECGAGSGMAAAALVTLSGGSARQALAAASLALQNTLGMICDPVANRVEVPCLGRNVLGASNALASANMALAGYDPVIPLDEVIGAMDAVGRSLPLTLRCTALGGLSVTPTSTRIAERLGRG